MNVPSPNGIWVSSLFARWVLGILSAGLVAAIGCLIALLVQTEGMHTELTHLTQQIVQIRADVNRIEDSMAARIRRLEDMHLLTEPRRDEDNGV